MIQFFEMLTHKIQKCITVNLHETQKKSRSSSRYCVMKIKKP